MIVLYIVLGLVFLLLLILLLDISLVFSYKNEFAFVLKLSFISVNGNKLIELAESSGKDSENNKKMLKNKKAVTKKKKSPFEVVDTLTYIFDLISAILGEFNRYSKLKMSKIKISIGSDNCAETALIYGIASSALYTVLEILDSFMTVKKNYKDIGVYPDFTSDECKIDLKIVLKIKIMHLLLALIHLLPAIAGAKKGK